MDKFQRSIYELRFELAYMKKKGKEFQDHFSEIMEKGHPGDFQRIKPWGNVGDQKCDGYLKSVKQMFAVYAPNEVEEAKTLKKVSSDFKGAKPHWKKHIEMWTFVHNSRDGLSPKLYKQLLTLDENEIDINVTQWGYEELRERVFSLSEVNLEHLYGYMPVREELPDVTYDNLLHVFDAIVKAALPLNGDIKPVSVEKLNANALSDTVKTLLTAGMERTHTVERFFAEYHDPSYGDEVAAEFNKKYTELKNQGNLTADQIFFELQRFASGKERGEPQHEVAVLTVLAYLFECCDIFEEPKTVS
jgi:hypothetical protein